jgi:tripartite ATP-independent transporter DctP family solute receptor
MCIKPNYKISMEEDEMQSTKTYTRRQAGAFLVATAGFISAPSVLRAQQINLVLSHHLPSSHLVHKTSESFAEKVLSASKGQIKIDIKPSSQLFNLRTAAEALQLGTLDLCWSDLGTLGNWKPELGFISMPFVFNDFNHVKKVIYGKLSQEVEADVRKSLNIDILSLGASGFRVFLSTKPIKNLDDCKGLKLRVPEVPTWVEMAKAIGANPTPIPAAEMYTALQTGVVDAVENPPDYLFDTKLWEVGKHSTKTHHIFTEVSLMASSAKLNTLSGENRKIIVEAAKQSVQEEMWTNNLRGQEDAWKSLEKNTIAVSEPDRAAFKAKTKTVIDAYIAKNGSKAKSYIDEINSAA